MFNMGAVKAFDVFLDDELEVYHIGESMKGRVVVSLTKDLAMKGKLVKFLSFFPLVFSRRKIFIQT